ncbi:MAG: HEAT repeat domain-containing protein [Parachlamydiaceae bacterium]|nr:HEAT repeat domain-containing protein [Parachlamydiaceae bacterium]
MELSKVALLYIILLSLGLQDAPLAAAEPAHIFYLIHTNKLDMALDHYQEYHNRFGRHDTEFLQQLGLSVLELGAKSYDAETLLMTLFGAGIAMNERTLPILIRAVEYPNPQLQLLALNFLARCQHDDADRSLLVALRSNSLVIRLEAAHQIAKKKHSQATQLIQSLMSKVDEELLPLFPQLYALIENPDAIRILRRLLSHHSEDVRIAAILSCAKTGRDDLLPKIKALATHASYAQQEACAAAFGNFNDDTAIPFLERFANSQIPEVRVAALKSLDALGANQYRDEIKRLALGGDLFAIIALGDIHGSQEALWQLAQSKNNQISLNAVVGLLKQCDPRSQKFLNSILIQDSRDLAFIKNVSPGKSLSCWKAVPSARQNCDDYSIDLELSQSFRESLLIEAMNLPEENFFQIAAAIFDQQQNDLVPTAIELLEQLKTDRSVQFLKSYQQRAGAPLIRNYCNLALYRLQEEGPYAANLRKWVLQQADAPLIQLRPLVPWEVDSTISNYLITPHETSRLLVESYEAFAQRQDDEGINALLNAVRNGNSKNKYALAGLLMRASL